jgi:hypothetical protein
MNDYNTKQYDLTIETMLQMTAQQKNPCISIKNIKMDKMY